MPTPRRSSSAFYMQLAEQSQSQIPQLRAQEEEIPTDTAASIAAAHFARELAQQEVTQDNAQAVVIIHDACFGHRFSRPRTTKALLSLIVERPERIRASILGISAAYVRLGARHSGSDNAPQLGREPSQRQPFAIRRSSRTTSILEPAVVAVHGKDWMTELHTMCQAAGDRLAAGEKEVERPPSHGGSAAEAQKPRLHEGDLYLCRESLDAFQGAIGGVCDAIDTVFDDTKSAQRAFVAVRPPGHHCAADFPSGFCWLNNVHIGIEYAAQKHALTHAAILDFDLHHGDGSQEIAWNRNARSAAMAKNIPLSKKLAIGYYSMHDINSYPCEMGDREKVQNASLCLDNAHGQSIWNVHLEPWKTTADFWALYEQKYLNLLEKARIFLQRHTARLKAAPKASRPRSAIFISAGFDASEWEGAGMQRHAVNVPTEFYARFTEDVVRLAQEEGTGAEGRVISVLEGGYSDRALTSGVMSHLSGLCHAAPHIAKTRDAENGEASQLAGAMDGLVLQSDDMTYDPSWWHATQLTALETYASPPASVPVKKARGGFAPTYSTPTQSFTGKVVNPERFYRTVSGTMRPIIEPARPKPSLEVDWVLATHELSKLLLPTDRSTFSCQPEELAAPKVKKERPSMLPTLPSEQMKGGRQLRDRKPKVADQTGPATDDEGVSVRNATAKANRRRTVADLPVSDPVEPPPMPSQPSRLSSITPNADAVMTATEDYDVPTVPFLVNGGASESMAEEAPPPDLMQIPKTRQMEASSTVPASIEEAIELHVAAASSSDPSVPAIGREATEDPAQGESASAVVHELATSDDSMGNIEKPAADPAPTAQPAPAQGSADLDQLTSGIKRITLKVGTREEHDQRQREREEAEKKAKAETRKKPRKIGTSKAKGAAARSSSSANAIPGSENEQPSGAAASGQYAPTGHQTLNHSTPQGDRLPQSSAQLDGGLEQQQNAGKSNGSHNAQAPPAPTNIGATPQLMNKGQPNDWSNRPRPAGPKQSGNLPVWSSTGVIPFGARTDRPSLELPSGQPQQPLLSPNGLEGWNGNGVSRSMLVPGDTSAAVTPEPSKETDVWEVPATPHKK